MPHTVTEALAPAFGALDALEALGQEIDDEWSYAGDLAEAWRDRLRAVDAGRGREPLDERIAAAIERAAEEAALVGDPHRALDWLSTLPQVVLVALGERP